MQQTSAFFSEPQESNSNLQFLNNIPYLQIRKVPVLIGIISLFLHENLCCEDAFEVPHQGASNEDPT